MIEINLDDLYTMICHSERIWLAVGKLCEAQGVSYKGAISGLADLGDMRRRVKAVIDLQGSELKIG